MITLKSAAAFASVYLCLLAPASAADNPVVGRWIDKLPSGASMIVEFSAAQVSFQSMTAEGNLLPPSVFPVTYKSEGKDQFVVAIEGQPSEPMAVMLTAPGKLSLKFPGRDARDLVRYVAETAAPAKPRAHP